jgi:V/A-type H+/Na+-transporting ATPase subunit I
MVTERMKKVEIVLFREDTEAALRYLGSAGCLQLIAEERGQRDAEDRELEAAREKLESLARFLGITAAPAGARPAGLDARARAEKLIASSRALLEEEAALLKRRIALRQSIEELEPFAPVKVSLSSLGTLGHLSVRVGSVAPEAVENLRASLSRRAVLLPLARPGLVLAMSSRKGRWAMDSELKKAGFQETALPEGVKGIPAEVLPSFRTALADADGALSLLDERKADFRAANEAEIRLVLAELAVDSRIDSVRQTLSGTGRLSLIAGWVPLRSFPGVVSRLGEITRGRLTVRSFEPSELPEVRSGETKVPVTFTNGPLVRSFRRMVFSYGVPLYGTIDPTPFVAVMFLLLFALMFGDVGQGFVGLALGALIHSGVVPSFRAWQKKRFGVVFMLAGGASMLSGLFYGSFFANEQVLVPVLRWLTLHITGTAMDRVISLEGTTRILTFFGVTIGIGAVINSVGLVINIANLVRQRRWEKAILNKTGVAGAIFFWYALSIAVRILLGGSFHGFDLAILAVPLLALFLREPLVHLIKGKRPLLGDGVLGFVMEGIVEILESATYYMSNSVSFLRVAAFGLAHTVLSLIVFSLAGMVSHSAAGPVFQALIVLVGNLIIIVLEGLIVTIQVIRLQYYEFFSKFFTDTGEEFQPFTLDASEVKQ